MNIPRGIKEYAVPGEKKGWWVFSYNPSQLRWWQLLGCHLGRDDHGWMFSFGVRGRALAVGRYSLAEVRAEKVRRHRDLADRLLRKED
jgi:hypothetical protein